jgi:hypothetical protein
VQGVGAGSLVSGVTFLWEKRPVALCRTTPPLVLDPSHALVRCRLELLRARMIVCTQSIGGARRWASALDVTVQLATCPCAVCVWCVCGVCVRVFVASVPGRCREGHQACAAQGRQGHLPHQGMWVPLLVSPPPQPRCHVFVCQSPYSLQPLRVHNVPLQCFLRHRLFSCHDSLALLPVGALSVCC